MLKPSPINRNLTLSFMEIVRVTRRSCVRKLSPLANLSGRTIYGSAAPAASRCVEKAWHLDRFAMQCSRSRRSLIHGNAHAPCRGSRVCGEMPQHRHNSTVLGARVKNEQPRKAWHSHKTYRYAASASRLERGHSRNVGGGHTCRSQPHDSKRCLSPVL